MVTLMYSSRPPASNNSIKSLVCILLSEPMSRFCPTLHGYNIWKTLINDKILVALILFTRSMGSNNYMVWVWDICFLLKSPSQYAFKQCAKQWLVKFNPLKTEAVLFILFVEHHKHLSITFYGKSQRHTHTENIVNTAA